MSVLGRRKQLTIYWGFVSLWAIAAIGYGGVFASSSPNYQLIETVIGGNGSINSSSTNYQDTQSGGIIGIGTSTGTNYQAQAGHETTNDPALSFAILSANPSFGSFSPTATATATSQFEVIDYTSYGYVVQISGTAPTNSSGHQIQALATNSAPTIGTEQYGFNLVANTLPISFGANPDFGQFGTGTVATNYNTANSYRFDSGDEIAYSGKTSGQTEYTISYIVDVSDVTPGGKYTSVQNIICTATY
ncbi:MAG: hypothetical protein ACREF7_04180 [Candidatus Saccharimonadales bacterium]